MKPADFNSYGARRGNHEVMMRGTFANIRLRNQLAPGTEGGWTVHQPDGEKMSIYDASMKYQKEGVPLIVLGGKEYGSGSSRDWAAKGTLLLGVRAVIAESYERIHRSNLLGMGVLPLQYPRGRVGAIARPYRIRGVHDRRRRETFSRAGRRSSRARTKTAKRKFSRPSRAPTRRKKSTTTGTAGFCRTCCGRCCRSAG